MDEFEKILQCARLGATMVTVRERTSGELYFARITKDSHIRVYAYDHVEEFSLVDIEKFGKAYELVRAIFKSPEQEFAELETDLRDAVEVIDGVVLYANCAEELYARGWRKNA